jgi:hypothetical protein
MNDGTSSEPPPVAAPVPGLPEPEVPAPVPTEARREYEFDDAQNKIINDLAMAIVWVRIPLLVAAIFQGIIAVGLAFRIPQDGAHIIGAFAHALAAVVCFLLASWLLRAAAAFARVTTTAGRDVANLMTGLKNLGSWFDLLAFFVKLYLILLGIILALLLVGLIAGAFTGRGAA